MQIHIDDDMIDLFTFYIHKIVTTNGVPVNIQVPSTIYVRNNQYFLYKPELDDDNQVIEQPLDERLVINVENIVEAALKQAVIHKIDEFGSDTYGDSETLLSNTVYPKLSTEIDTVSSSLSDLFKFFYKKFFSVDYDFDINGYSLIFLYPPDLSGFANSNNTSSSAGTTGVDSTSYLSPPHAFEKFFKDFMIFAVDFEIPDQQISTSEISLSNSEKIEFVSGFSTSGDLSVRYIDNTKLKIYKFHSNWITYMKMVMRGDIEPDPSYYNKKEVDYMASLYFLKFKSSMDYPNYIGKATGIFPKNLPVKELLGSRTENQIVMYNINYFYTLYEGDVLTYEEDTIGNIVLDGGKPKLKIRNAIYDEFNDMIMTAYSPQTNT